MIHAMRLAFIPLGLAALLVLAGCGRSSSDDASFAASERVEFPSEGAAVAPAAVSAPSALAAPAARATPAPAAPAAPAPAAASKGAPGEGLTEFEKLIISG